MTELDHSNHEIKIGKSVIARVLIILDLQL